MCVVQRGPLVFLRPWEEDYAFYNERPKKIWRHWEATYALYNEDSDISVSLERRFS